jgi:hypothetical protein
VDAQIVEPTRNKHEQIGDALLRVPQHFFHTPRPFHSRQGMFDPDADAGDGAVRPLLGFRECALPGLFFG